MYPTKATEMEEFLKFYRNQYTSIIVVSLEFLEF